MDSNQEQGLLAPVAVNEPAKNDNVSVSPVTESTRQEESGKAPEAEKQTHKLTDEEFKAALHANYGLYAQTARYIERKYGISYSRQSVQQRAIHFRDEINQQQDTVHDLAQGVLFNAILQEKDPKFQYRAAIYLLNKFNEGKKQNS